MLSGGRLRIPGLRRSRDAAGDFLGAAEQYATIGALPLEAYARLRAAETLVLAGRRAEADPELQRASLSGARSVRPRTSRGRGAAAAAAG